MHMKVFFNKWIENLIDIENKIIIENYEPQTKARAEDNNRVLNETKYNLFDHYLDLNFLLSCINILSPIKLIAYSTNIKKRCWSNRQNRWSNWHSKKQKSINATRDYCWKSITKKQKSERNRNQENRN